MRIRDAALSDVPSLLDIYSYYVENTAVSFELEVPGAEEMAERIRSADVYLAAEDDEGIEGFAYSHLFSQRAAYSISREVSIYLRHGKERQGIGRALYSALEERLKPLGVRNLYAIAMHPGYGSIEFHQSMGYRIVGKLTDCGEKFGRLWSVAYLEKRI